MVQLIPRSIREFWGLWEIRGLVLLSLFFQSILILIGNRRKHSTSDCLRFFVWFAYLSADWIATLSLSSLMSNTGTNDDQDSITPKYIIRAFWAPFLLLHLGGPDTITAYSIEDNELWWRHLVTLSVQIGVAFYIFLRAWSADNELNFLSAFIFVAGIIKICERTWVQRSASSKCFRKSMFPRPDPGPNYAKYMDDYKWKKDEGFNVYSGTIVEVPTVGDHVYAVPAKNPIPNAAKIRDAYSFFAVFKRLFADLILNIHDIVNSLSFFQNRNFDKVFEMIEIELGFMHDVYFTKAGKFYSRKAGFLRIISFSFILYYSRVDVSTTYVLLVGALVIEIFAAILLLGSDWAMLWLSTHKSVMVEFLHRTFSSSDKKRWSNKIAQHHLIEICVKAKDIPHFNCRILQSAVVQFYEFLENNGYKKHEPVSNDLKQLIFQQLLKKSRKASDSSFKERKQFCAQRGRWILQEHEKCLDEIGWRFKDAEFDQSILLWHIATDLCYHSDEDESSSSLLIHKKNSKFLSEYLLYLLVKRPFMLPNGIGQIRFQDTRAEAIEFFKEKESTDVKEACTTLLAVSTEIPPSKVKGDRCKSVLFDACRLAKALQNLEMKEKKWEMISHVWVEMLCYGAVQCQRNHHAQQLRKGGELLTHVWLLMAHLGITEQFQISKGEARAKLILQ
ncbi:hypothetical protein UlMin_012000 [Ulmus minor]